MKNLSLFFLVLFCGHALAAQFDPPDLNLEYELHRQYLMIDDQGAIALPRARESMTESYRIQGGDTLWGLSRMLYGDGHFWPKVWSQNQDISNPHLIRQGHTLQFLMGSEDDTPAFRFSEEDDESGVELASARSSESSIQIPPPEIQPKPVLNIPQSFPHWQSVYRGSNKAVLDERGLNFQRAQPANQSSGERDRSAERNLFNVVKVS